MNRNTKMIIFKKKDSKKRRAAER